MFLVITLLDLPVVDMSLTDIILAHDAHFDTLPEDDRKVTISLSDISS